MLGFINDCIEKLVLEKYGVDTWHTIKQKAGCEVPDGAFYKLEHYSDQSTIDLVVSASQVSGLTIPQVIEVAGEYFVHYAIQIGYENLLCCQGGNLREFITNINAIHQHLQTTFPNKMVMPEFWCESNKTDGSLTLYYYSKRGNLLAPLALGIVREVATLQFDLDIVMDQTSTQDVDGAKFTWYVFR